MVVGFLTGMGAGCGAVGNALRTESTDVRGAALVKGDQPKVLLTGPGWLLHVNPVNNDRRQRVTVYRVPRHEGTVADCQRPNGGMPSAAEPVDAHARASVYVRAHEVVCATATKQMRLSWHAQPLAAPDPTQEALATLQ